MSFTKCAHIARWFEDAGKVEKHLHQFGVRPWCNTRTCAIWTQWKSPPFNFHLESEYYYWKIKSGKSAVAGDIIDYCMGGSSCNIKDGGWDTVDWYGLLFTIWRWTRVLWFERTQKKHSKQRGLLLEVGKEIESPQTREFSSTQNVDGIEEHLPEEQEFLKFEYSTRSLGQQKVAGCKHSIGALLLFSRTGRNCSQELFVSSPMRISLHRLLRILSRI